MSLITLFSETRTFHFWFMVFRNIFYIEPFVEQCCSCSSNCGGREKFPVFFYVAVEPNRTRVHMEWKIRKGEHSCREKFCVVVRGDGDMSVFT